MKRLIALMLSALLVFTGVCGIIPVSAAESVNPTSNIQNDMTVKGTNSFGNLLTESLETKMDEQAENNGCNIFSVEMSGNVATVEFETVNYATLVIGIYDDSGEKMIASGSTDVEPGDTTAKVTIDIAVMPQYFYIRGFLADANSYRPLCTVYESPMYTQVMQEFLAKTTDDFDSDRVLNLDDDSKTNFAVFGDDVKVIPKVQNKNNVATVDETHNKYVITNADSSITSLKAGEIFAHGYGDGQMLIVKIATISVSGTTVTITGQETTLEEVFAHVKVEGEAYTGDAQVDPSTCDEGVIYNGIVDDTTESGQPMYKIEAEGKTGKSLSFSLKDDDFEGTLNFKTEVTTKLYLTWNFQYLELNLDYSAGLSVSFYREKEIEKKFSAITFMPVAGVVIEFCPVFIARLEGKITLVGKITGNIGFAVTWGEMKNLTTSPHFESEAKLEGSLYIAIGFEPKIELVSDKLAKASVKAVSGIEAVVEVPIEENNAESDSRHDCKVCIDGDINAKTEVSFEAELLNWDKLKFEIKGEWTNKLYDFYYSLDYNEFGFSTCPHYSYKTKIYVKDANNKPIKDAVVNDKYTSNSLGIVTMYLNTGKHWITAQKGDSLAKKEIEVKELTPFNKNSFVVKMPAVNKKMKLPISKDQKVVAVSSGTYAAIASDGSLYMWGNNYYGQLGDGTNIYRGDEPAKVLGLNNIVSVSLSPWGEFSAAITSDGSVYMWGRNKWGQLGDGTTIDRNKPVKVTGLSNVVSVCLSNCCSAAITKDGSLYMWGQNDDGQLGDGTTVNRTRPVKVNLDNVVSISLGSSHSGALTKDGSLYMWGSNYCGAVGVDASFNYSKYYSSLTPSKVSTPTKILDNVSSVHCWYDYSSAIKNNGDMYVWGNNSCGELGVDYTGWLTGESSGDRYPFTHTPKRRIGNVSEIIHPAYCVITKDSALLALDGTQSERILENVAFADVYSDNKGLAITNDGDLYTIDGYSTSKIEIPDENALLTQGNDQSLLKSTMIEDVSGSSKSTATFSDLVPGETYNFYTIKSRYEESGLSSDNLLYVTQAAADSSGKLSVTYFPDEDYEDAEIFVVAMTPFSPEIDRLGGSNRIETANLISDSGWENGADNVILSSAASFADALAAVPLAYKLDAPILLTHNVNYIEPALLDQMKKLNVKHVIIVGGTKVVNTTLENLLNEQGYTTERLADKTRYGTAVKIAQRLDELRGGKPTQVFIANGMNYPDALSIGPVAALLDAPILFVEPLPQVKTLHDVTKAYLESVGFSGKVTLVGGLKVLSEDLLTETVKLGASDADRVYGSTRYLTAFNIYQKYKSCFTGNGLAFATGRSFPDALAGGVLASKNSIPVLLVDRYEETNEMTEMLHDSRAEKVYVFGGENVVSDITVEAYLMRD